MQPNCDLGRSFPHNNLIWSIMQIISAYEALDYQKMFQPVEKGYKLDGLGRNSLL